MPVTVVCPECGAKQTLGDDVGLAARCAQCRATLTAAPGAIVFEPEPERQRKKKRKRPPPSAETVADGEFRRRANAGVNWLLLGIAVNVAAMIVGVASRGRGDIARAGESAAWIALAADVAAAACACAAAGTFRPLGKELDHAEPAEWAWRLGVAMLALSALALGPWVRFLSELVWLGDWALYLLLVVMVQRVCIRIDRGDLRDSGDFVLRMGTGVVVFSTLAWLLLFFAPLMGFGGLGLLLALFALLCLPLWALSYALLLFRVRAALATRA